MPVLPHARVTVVLAMVVLVGSTIRLPAQRGGAAGQPSAASASGIPADLRPLLTPHSSEMAMVRIRYTQDRSLLNGNFAGSSGGRGGAGTAAVPISPMKIARLKRYDLSWAAALSKITSSKLTSEARVDLDSLQAIVRRNQSQLDSDAVNLGAYSPLVPFRQPLVDLIESRLRFEDVRSEASARVLDQATRSLRLLREEFKTTRRASPSQATLAAGAADALRTNLASWFNFYNGYDPLFTWWMGMPYKSLDQGLREYAVFLRDTIAVANQASSFQTSPLAIAASPESRFSEVPDLAEILALPQDELTDITNRFFGRGAGGGRGGNGGGTARDAKYYLDWLTALKSLEFDNLSRNAQVDYLYIKKLAELGLARDGKILSGSNPRKADDSGIPGAARGREGLIRDLQDELINYSPEQLMVLADREFAWCEKEMLKASRAMGFGDDWKAALEKVKNTYVPPGGQPGMIRDLVFEAIDYLRAKDLVTVPAIAAESQRMSMMSPAQQLASPFFLGGSQILVSYPTNEMEFDARMQSMRGNNPYFSHATAFHELIPGHNLTGYMGSRYGNYRATLAGSDPFYNEGWALYWEVTLYDKGFHDTPEERVGALFWRMHRSARIIFSLKFHMGEWSPQQAVDFLVDRVGHERDNAKAEVVRSFQGNYGPLYQAAYLLGGLQLRGLRREVVDSKQMGEKAFHDEILRQGAMPINLLRLTFSKQKLTRDMNIDWDFYGPLPEK